MATGKLFLWALDYRLENTEVLAKLPTPAIPLWLIDGIWIPSFVGTCIFACLSVAAAYQTIQRLAYPNER